MAVNVSVEYRAEHRSATILPNFQRNLGPLSSVQETRASFLLQCNILVRTLPFAAIGGIFLNWRLRPEAEEKGPSGI